MFTEDRRKLIVEQMNHLANNPNATIIFSDSAQPDNYVQFAGLYCEVSSRRWKKAKLPPLSPGQIDQLAALGFTDPGGRKRKSANNLVREFTTTDLDIIPGIVEQCFQILDSHSNFDLSVQLF